MKVEVLCVEALRIVPASNGIWVYRRLDIDGRAEFANVFVGDRGDTKFELVEDVFEGSWFTRRVERASAVGNDEHQAPSWAQHALE